MMDEQARKRQFEDMKRDTMHIIMHQHWDNIKQSALEKATTWKGLTIRLAVLNWAATCIQRGYRRRITWVEFKAAVKWKHNWAAKTLQRMFRGKKVKRFAKSLGSLFRMASIILQRAYRHYRRRRLLYMVRKTGQILVHHERLRLKRIALEEQKKKEIERQRIVDQTGAVLLLQKHHHVKQKHKKRKARELQEAKEEAARIAKLETQIKEARSRYSLEEELGKLGKRGMVSNFLLEHRYKRNLRKTLPPLVTRRTKVSFVDKFKNRFSRTKRATQELEKKRGLVYSIFAHQKTVIGIRGLTDFHITIGEAESEAFRKKQHISDLANKPFFQRLGLDLTSQHRNESGALQPQSCLIWGQFELSPIYKQYTDLQIVPLPPSNISKVDVSRHKLALVADGVRIVQHKLLPFEFHLRKNLKSSTSHAKPIIDMKVIGETLVDQEQANQDGFEELDIDLGALIDDIDEQRLKTNNYVDINKASKLWIKRLSAKEFHSKRLDEAKKVAGRLYQGPEEKRNMMLNTVEFSGLSSLQIAKIHRKFQEVACYAAAVAEVSDVASENVYIDDILLFMEEKRTMLTELIFQLFGFEVGNAIEAETMDFAEFFTFVSKLCLMGRHDLLRFLFFSMAAHSGVEDRVHRWHMIPLIRMIKEQYPRSVSEQQIRKVKNAFNLPDCTDKFGKFHKRIGDYTHPDFTIEEMFDLDKRFHSLFQPLYKVHENFVRVFLGKQFWRRHKRLFHEARTLISADMTHAIFDEGSSSDESEGSEDGS
eukprot:g8522.t1